MLTRLADPQAVNSGRLARRLARADANPYLGGMASPTIAPAQFDIESRVTLTEAAAARVTAIAVRQGKPASLRLSVEGGGCSGFQYRFELDDTAEPGDLTTQTGEATLLVDPASLELIKGSLVDFVESLGGASFQVTNPNAAAGCGCGSSFAV